MKIAVLIALSIFALPSAHAGPIGNAIELLHPKLSHKQRKLYARHIAKQAKKQRMNPLMAVALIHIESRFTNMTKNKTRDYGLMQVHWQRVSWLKGNRHRLMDPGFNIYAGFMELAYWRKWCNGKRGVKGHHWVNHYLYGNYVKSRRYEWAIMRVYRKLRRHAETRKTKISHSSTHKGVNEHRSHGEMPGSAHSIPRVALYKHRLRVGHLLPRIYELQLGGQ